MELHVEIYLKPIGEEEEQDEKIRAVALRGGGIDSDCGKEWFNKKQKDFRVCALFFYLSPFDRTDCRQVVKLASLLCILLENG